jgi:hypothetical protein
MAKVDRGIVKPPNQELQGLAATRSHAPRAEMPVMPCPKPAPQGGSADLTRQSSPVAAASCRFNVDNACMPQPPSAIEPGKGDVPVNPFLASGAAVIRVLPIVDGAKQQ